jgi:hypothetical protein
MKKKEKEEEETRELGVFIPKQGGGKAVEKAVAELDGSGPDL